MLGRLLLLWWPKWQGIGFHRWAEPLSRTYAWSVLLGWLEVRRVR
jgi:hypothetical protein